MVTCGHVGNSSLERRRSSQQLQSKPGALFNWSRSEPQAALRTHTPEELYDLQLVLLCLSICARTASAFHGFVVFFGANAEGVTMPIFARPWQRPTGLFSEPPRGGTRCDVCHGASSRSQPLIVVYRVSEDIAENGWLSEGSPPLPESSKSSSRAHRLVGLAQGVRPKFTRVTTLERSW